MSENPKTNVNVPPPALKIVPTIYPTSPPIDTMLDRFWQAGAELERVITDVKPPEKPLALLEQLGPSPFPRGGFPLIGFLATTYDKVGRYALERADDGVAFGTDRS